MTPEYPAGRALARTAVIVAFLVDKMVFEVLAVWVRASNPENAVYAMLAAQIQPQILRRKRTAERD